ncbi:TPA: cell surface protein, partial [Streptococcus suis]|nr:cell surface protein [Streptococcus suis]HEM5432932.1 cell surface protein [Streptococcus suis]HEM5439599.1 cell surface protein [Streptococcus suis]HEM5459677.1 cell surface protein [Streptococcus suis]
MSKQKVVSSLLLSTVVLGGLAFYSTTTVKAESLEPDVTSVSSSDATNKLVVSNEEESDFLAEEELEESDAPVETLNEEIKDVTEPGALLQPRAMMSNSETSGMEEIPVDDEFSDYTEEKVIGKQAELIQSSNADYWNGSNQEKLKKSVSIELLKTEEGQITWRVNFDTSEWSFNHHNGGIYFILPQGLKLTSIKGNGETELFSQFPTEVKSPNNNSGAPYRFFDREENIDYDRNFDNQWSWSAGQANPNDTIQGWKVGNRFSKIYFIDKIQSTSQVIYTLTAKVTEPNQKSFPLVAVMKSFKYKNSGSTEVTSLGAREIFIDEIKVQKPKEEAPKTNPEPEAPS